MCICIGKRNPFYFRYPNSSGITGLGLLDWNWTSRHLRGRVREHLKYGSAMINNITRIWKIKSKILFICLKNCCHEVNHKFGISFCTSFRNNEMRWYPVEVLQNTENKRGKENHLGTHRAVPLSSGWAHVPVWSHSFMCVFFFFLASN